MSGIDWLVLLGGIGSIALVNWYFFLAGRAGDRVGKAHPPMTGGEGR